MVAILCANQDEFYHLNRMRIQFNGVFLTADRVWFTADQHYGHTNIIQHCARPFTSVGEMDDALINRHNSKVLPDDLVISVGDFSFRNRTPSRHYRQRLNGRFLFVKGNHDKHPEKAGFEWVYDVVLVTIDTTPVWVSHYPHLSWPRYGRGAIHVWGHCHGTVQGKPRSMDVGVDTNHFDPYSWEQIQEGCRHEQ